MLLRGVKAIAEYCCVTPKTIYNWINLDGLPVLRDPESNQIIISTASIELWTTAYKRVLKRKTYRSLQKVQALQREANRKMLAKRWKPIARARNPPKRK